jgi:hypothetical protein
MTKVSIGSHDKPKFNIGDIVTYNLAVFMVTDECEGAIDTDKNEFVGVVLYTGCPDYQIGEVIVLEKSVFSAFHGTITINSDL